VNAEDWLGSLDPIGWRFGLERIKALLDALDNPQRAFESVHVVGTNGKSSVTVMTAALLEAAGKSTGAYLSPHAERWAERTRLGGQEITADAFERAASEVRAAVAAVEEGLEDDERITQFEAATAAALVALRDAGVDVGVIEAGLGGRLDATNVLDSRVTVLTSIGLDHTQWLGETEREIANEKLAVLQPGSTLVLGDVSDAVAAQARDHAAKLECAVVEPLAGQTSTSERYGAYSGTSGSRPAEQESRTGRHGAQCGTFALGAPYLARNFAIARSAAEVVLGAPLGDAVIAKAMATLDLPGRFELTDGDPPVIRDAAHNPDGARALAEAIRERFDGRPVVGCLAILADKDAAGIIGALAPVLTHAVVCEIPPVRLEGAGRPGTASVLAAELVRLAGAEGLPAEAVFDPGRAVARATEHARELGGVALVAGSHYLLGYG
jgi:dihydrofolate synthase / folylpolyglutamate synthase